MAGLRQQMDETTHGLAGEWMCMMFDRAVMVFGTWVDNKLEERDSRTHRRVWTLKELLADKPLSSVKRAMMTSHAELPPTLQRKNGNQE